MKYKTISTNEKVTVVECDGKVIQISSDINIEDMLSILIIDKQYKNQIENNDSLENANVMQQFDNNILHKPAFKTKK